MSATDEARNAAATGTIHDLGYKRYVGTRRPPSTRWRVIMREQIANGWKKWWRFKMPLAGAVITMCIAGGLLFIGTTEVIGSLGKGAEKAVLTMLDGIVPLSIEHFNRMAFVLSLTLGASIIANDSKSGAFTFYYVRSVRPRDYVLGKLAGYGLLVGLLVMVGPLLLACFRLGMCEDLDQVIEYLPILPKVLAIGALGTLAYTTIPLAISAVVPNRRYALAMWCAYYLIIGSAAAATGALTGNPSAAVDLQAALGSVTMALFDLQVLGTKIHTLDPWIAVASLVGQSALAIGILGYQVSREQKTGVGGAS